MRLKFCFAILATVLLFGCKAESKVYVIPSDYTGAAVMKVYADNTENTYNVNIIVRGGNYSIRTTAGGETWNTAYLSGGRCVLNNDKFPDGSVTIEDFQLEKLLVHDFDLEKFDNSSDPSSDETIYYDGTYRHDLKFSRETMLPESIHIYKNDNLVKTIEYENIKIEE